MAEIQGPKWRVLAILNGRTPEEVVIGDQKPPSLGPLAELSDLHKDVAEVHIMRTPALAEIPRQLQAWRPNLVYVYGGVPGMKADIEGQGVAPLALLHGPKGVLVEAAVDLFLSSFAGLPLEAVFFDFHGSAPLAQKLLDQQQHSMHSSGASEAEGGEEPGGGCAAIGWPADVAAPVLPAWDFARAFFGMLRTPGVSVPEAYAFASRAALSHCTIPPAAESGGGDASAAPPEPPQLPLLLPADLSPVLPNCASIEAPQIEDADLSQGVAAAFPGYADLRLLAPNAELRLLMAGHSAMVNPHNLK